MNSYTLEIWHFTHLGRWQGSDRRDVGDVGVAVASRFDPQQISWNAGQINKQQDMNDWERRNTRESSSSTGGYFPASPRQST